MSTSGCWAMTSGQNEQLLTRYGSCFVGLEVLCVCVMCMHVCICIQTIEYTDEIIVFTHYFLCMNVTYMHICICIYMLPCV